MHVREQLKTNLTCNKFQNPSNYDTWHLGYGCKLSHVRTTKDLLLYYHYHYKC